MKAGIIGLGVGMQHLDGYAAAGVEVAAICDFDIEKMLIASKKLPEAKFYTRAEDLIDASDVDVVSIASNDDHHFKQVTRAISNGKHVFVEKPLCLNSTQLREIYRALQINPNVRLSSNTILRMSERFRSIKKVLSDGEVGKVYYVEADYNYGRLHKLLQGWRGEITNYSVMLGGGIHVVDLLIWLVGSDVVEATAFGNKECSIGSTFKTPDMIVALLKFRNGVVGKVSANFGCVYPHFHKMSIYGTSGTIENTLRDCNIFRSRESSAIPETLDAAYPGVSKGDLIPGFIDEIRGVGRAEVNERDVFRAVSVCLAIDESVATGKPQKVEGYYGD